MADLELALKQRDEARAELEQVKKSNMHLVIENAQLKPKAEKYDEFNIARVNCECYIPRFCAVNFDDAERLYNHLAKKYAELNEQYNEYLKRIEELEQKNKVLVEGVKVVFNNLYITEYGGVPYIQMAKGLNNISLSIDHLDKIKAMLELVEVEE